MNDAPTSISTGSPFHAGEQAIQSRTGKREIIENVGRKMIRPFMPDQHRAFFEQLPFVVLGSVDADGWPWASILSAGPGFMTSPDPRRLNVSAMPIAEDPLEGALKPNAPIGLLGIEMQTRRRNRMNAHIIDTDANGFSLGVDQSFGNCPRYIHPRDAYFMPKTDKIAQNFRSLDAAPKPQSDRLIPSLSPAMCKRSTIRSSKESTFHIVAGRRVS